MNMNMNKNLDAYTQKFVVDNFLDEHSTKTYNLISSFLSNKNLVDKFLNGNDVLLDDLDNLHIFFAVTVRNENERLKNCKIIPCFITKVDDKSFNAIPMSIELASKLYHDTYPTSKVDNMFATRYGTCFFLMNKDTNEMNFTDESTSNTKFFNSLNNAKKYLDLYTKWFKTKKKEDEDRRKNGTFTVAEIAEKLGISIDNLKIVDDGDTGYEYFNGACRENYGELSDTEYNY